LHRRDLIIKLNINRDMMHGDYIAL